MSQNLNPLPIDTPISDEPKFSALKFGAIWNLFLKAMSDDMLAANIVNNLASSSITSPVAPTVTQTVLNATARAFKYTLHANRCEVTYYNETPLTDPLIVNLPYTAALAFDIDGVIQPPLTKSITIPANTGYIRFWYVVQATRN